MNHARPMAARLKNNKPRVEHEPRSAHGRAVKKERKQSRNLNPGLTAWVITQLLSYDALRASCHARPWRPIFGAKFEAWRHKMFHVFHFFQSDMV